MQPPEKTDEVLVCFRGGTPVRAEAPQCPHPSSFCDYRTTCMVVEAQRERRRAGGEQDEE